MGIAFRLSFHIIYMGPKGPSTRREIVSPFIFSMEKKLLSAFVDESGDDGFGKEGSSEFYIFTMVFHDQRLSIESNVEKIARLPVFHAGPILRREEPFDNDEPEERKNCFSPSLSSPPLYPSSGLRSNTGRGNSKTIFPFKGASSGI